MKKAIIIFVVVMLLGQYIKGQNSFFIGQKSYPCTDNIHLKSNSNNERNGHDLDVVIAKNGEAGMIVLSTEVLGGSITSGVRIKGNALIYLADGSAITCYDKGIYDFVDNIATTVYYLTKEETSKLKKNNIVSIRFSIKCVECISSSEEGNFSASNKYKPGYSWDNSSSLYVETDVPALVKALFGN